MIDLKIGPSKILRDYIDYEAIGMVLSFVLLLRLLEFFCIGKEVSHGLPIIKELNTFGSRFRVTG